MGRYEIALEEDRFYHIYNRGNNSDPLFYNNANYEYFLKKYDQYVSDFVETYAFCLLPNHFHLLIRVKSEKEIDIQRGDSFLKGCISTNMQNSSAQCHRTDLTGFQNLSGLKKRNISKQFSDFFNAYSKAINKQQNRHGSLFEKPFKRIQINNTTYLANLVFYIHANPQLHHIVDDFKSYSWSSYQRILNDSPSKLQKQQVIEWFNDKKNFEFYHSQKIDLAINEEFMLE